MERESRYGKGGLGEMRMRIVREFADFYYRVLGQECAVHAIFRQDVI